MAEPLFSRRGNDRKPITNLSIGELIPNKNPTNTFVADIRVMFGDADFYDNIKIRIPEEEHQVLLDLLNFLKLEVATAYPNGRGGDDEYSSVVKDWDKWFGYNDETNVHGRYCDYWLSNWDLGGESTFEYVRVEFFDADGVGHDVTVE